MLEVGVNSNTSATLQSAENDLEQIWSLINQSTSQVDSLNVLDSLLIQSINAVGDLHQKRVTAGAENRIPSTIWNGLIILLVLSMSGLGYFFGIKGTRSPIASTGLALSFAAVIFLIADLDRPLEGRVKHDQSLMHKLNDRLATI